MPDAGAAAGKDASTGNGAAVAGAGDSPGGMATDSGVVGYPCGVHWPQSSPCAGCDHCAPVAAFDPYALCALEKQTFAVSAEPLLEAPSRKTGKGDLREHFDLIVQDGPCDESKGLNLVCGGERV